VVNGLEAGDSFAIVIGQRSIADLRLLLSAARSRWPVLGNILARKPTRKIPTRMAMSVVSTVVSVIACPVLRPGGVLDNEEQ